MWNKDKSCCSPGSRWVFMAIGFFGSSPRHPDQDLSGFFPRLDGRIDPSAGDSLLFVNPVSLPDSRRDPALESAPTAAADRKIRGFCAGK